MCNRQAILGPIISVPLLFLLGTSLQAKEPAAQPAMVQFGLLAGKSSDALEEFSRDMGFFLDFNETPYLDKLEQKYFFAYVLRTEWLARDKPIGIAFLGTPGVNADAAQMMVFLFPVRTDVNILRWLTDHGATAVPDHPDTVLLNGVALRRTTNHLVVSANPAALGVINIKSITDAVSNEDALARLSIDLKWVRKNMPYAYKGITNLAARSTGAAGLLAPMMTIDSLDRFDASLDNGKNGFRFAVTVAPLSLRPPARINRPGMPPDVLCRLDWGVPIDAAYPPTRDLYSRINDIFAGSLDNGESLTVEGKQQRTSFLERRAALERNPAAMAIGLEIVEGTAVVYVRQHWPKEIDVFDEVRHMAASFNAVNQELKSGKSLELQTYVSNDDQVLRAVLKDGGKAIDCSDFVQKGTDVYIALSTSEQHWVGRLIAARDEGRISSVFSGWLDLGKLANHLDDMFPNSGPEDLLPKEARPLLVKAFANERILITTSSDGSAATFEVTGSKELIRKLGALSFAIVFRH